MANAECRPKAIVVGGSLGGLMAALWLRQADFDVIIFERSATSLSGKGAGIALNPATIRYFKEHDTVDLLSRISVSVSNILYLRTPPQPPLPPVPCKYRLTSYNSLLAALMYHFPQECYRYAHRVVDISQTANFVSVKTADGKVETCDLLVCADGTESSTRSMLLGSGAEEAEYAGYIAWRGIVEEGCLSKNASSVLRNSFVIFFTPDGHIASYPIPVVSNDLQQVKFYINWLWYRNIPQGEQLDALMTDTSGKRRARSIPPGYVQSRFVNQLKNDLGNIPEPIDELIRITESPFIQAIFDHESKDISFGRICLLGDAAFSVRPHIAVGTAKAAEDARQLALAMKNCQYNIPNALSEYASKQMELGRSCVQRGREVGRLYQSGQWELGQKLLMGLFRPGDSEME